MCYAVVPGSASCLRKEELISPVSIDTVTNAGTLLVEDICLTSELCGEKPQT